MDNVYEDVPTGALFDAFHEPFPSTALYFAQQPGNSGGFSKLPLEIFDLIFASLSPSSLDAARCTCRSWHAMIMASSNVLKSVLQKTAPETRKRPLPRDKPLRTLHRRLDIEADLVRRTDDADTWRTRFRHCEIDFLVAPLCDHSHIDRALPASSLASAKFCVEGTPLAYVITELTVAELEKPRQMIFYHIGITQRPYYVGTIPFSAKNGNPRILSLMGAAKYSYRWTLCLEINGDTRHYSICTISGFSSHNSPYTLRAIASPKVPDIHQEYRMPALQPRVPPGSRLWDVLFPLPDLEASNTIVRSNSVTSPTQFRLAQHRETGSLYAIYVKNMVNTVERRDSVKYLWPSRLQLSSGLKCEQEVVSIAYLIPPREDCVHRNAAIAHSLAADQSAQIAVIWQNPSIDPGRSELYLYEIMSESIKNHEGEIIFAELSAKPRCEAADPGYLLEQSINGCAQIQAKRIRSLHSGAGGVHLFSPLWKSTSTAALKSKLERQATLGGLRILQTDDNARYPSGTKATYQAIHLWGPDASKVHLNIFDLSYAGSNLRAPPKRWGFSYPPASIGKADHMLSESPYYDVPCQCTLHDDGYQVLLPDVRCSAMGPVKGRYSLGWSKGHQPTPAPGIITHYDPPARVEALKRREEWLKERIRYMKRAGISNKSISFAWYEWAWTRYGVIEKPRGWETLEV